MISTKIYLDTRASSEDKPAPLKLTITKKGKSALLPLNVSVLATQWDKNKEQIVNHPNKLFLNNFIKRRRIDVETELLKLISAGRAKDMTVTEIKNEIADIFNGTSVLENAPLFLDCFIRFADAHQETTKGVYMQTVSRMRAFDKEIEQRTFDDINREWLQRFDKFMAQTAPSVNARNIHFRNIRAVFNYAIENEITTLYPFRKFKLHYEKTAKRYLTLEQLKTLRDCVVDEHQAKYRDIFLLMFYLIGINIKDLFYLKEINNGYIEYIRFKTRKPYRIKVEPEALAIIDKYRGENYLLDIADRYSNHQDFLKRMNLELKRIGAVTYVKYGKKTFSPLFPKLSTYWCRHTWATLAAEIEIAKETIAAALGHGGNSVTDIYINFDQKKIEVANRAVIDYLNK